LYRSFQLMFVNWIQKISMANPKIITTNIFRLSQSQLKIIQNLLV
jgi:hypothetical protein